MILETSPNSRSSLWWLDVEKHRCDRVTDWGFEKSMFIGANGYLSSMHVGRFKATGHPEPQTSQVDAETRILLHPKP